MMASSSTGLLIIYLCCNICEDISQSSLTSLNCDRLKGLKKKSPKCYKTFIQNDNHILLTQMQLANGEISIGHFLEKSR